MTKRAEAKDLYLSALRGDAAAQRKCTAMGKQCGGRCIPKHWNCRLKGEGEEPPTRGNRVELTPEVRARLKARRSAKRNSTLRKVAGLAALTAGAAGVGALAARRGISSGNVTGAASTAAGLITAANPAAALPGALAAAGAGMGARLYQQGQRVERFRTQIRGLSGRLNANLNRIRQYEREIGANERKLSSLMTQIANSESQRDMRKLRAEADTVLKMLDRDKRRMKNLRESAPRTQALIERATRRAQPTVGKVLRAAVSEVNQASSTGRRIRSERGAFRRNFGLTGSGKPGPKPTDWLDRYTNLDASEERTDKKCGESGIAENKKCTKGTGKGRQVAKAAATAALVAGGAVALRQASKAGLGKTKATQGAKGPWVASKGRRMTTNEIEALRRMRERGQGKYGAQPRRRTGDEVEHHGETFSGYNQPKRTPSHPTKSHAVLAKEGESVKLIRFGQQGVKGSPPKEGESESYRNRRRSFQARHAKNIAKGKMSAAYWANRAKWDAAGEQRLGKPCGESHIPKAKKCTKGSGVAGKVALAATGAAAVALFVKRKEAQSALTKAVLSAERAVAGQKGRQAYEEIRKKVPESLRAQADKAVGSTKTVLGVMANHATSPIEVVGINARQGFVTGRFKQGEELISIGSVGRDVIEARSEKGRANEWTVTFTVNSTLTRQTPRSATEARRIFNTARAMIKDQASRMPKGATLFAEGAVGDGSEKARNRIYKRWGFQDDGDGGLTMNASDF